MENLQKDFQNLSNHDADMKRVVEEGSSSKGIYRTPFISPPHNPPNKPTPSAQGMSLEGLHHDIQSVLVGADNTYDITVEEQVR